MKPRYALLRRVRAPLLALAFGFSLTQCATPLLVIGAAAGVGYYLGAERRPGYVISQDNATERYVIEQLKKRHIDPDRLKIMAYNHRLLLIGRVPTRQTANMIYAIAQKAPYVKKIYNRLEIGRPLGSSQKAHDAWLATKVKAALIARKGLTSASIRFAVYNGVVYLMGLVTKEEAWRAIDATRKVSGVRKVVDALERYIPEEQAAPLAPIPSHVRNTPVAPPTAARPASGNASPSLREVLEY